MIVSAWYLGIDVGFDAGMFPTKRTTEYAYGQKADGSWDSLYLGSRRYSPSYTTASVLATQSLSLLTSRQYLRQIILTLSPQGKNSESTDLSRITVIHPNR